jgi:hypothetical protein
MPNPSLNALEALGMQSTAILNDMDATFPPLSAGPNDEIKHIMYRAGQRSVVDWLIKRLEN